MVVDINYIGKDVQRYLIYTIYYIINEGREIGRRCLLFEGFEIITSHW
jgi:hypothetical protein